MAFNPTPQQSLAISEKGNILVAAAAGSGKTAVLVERVIAMLTDSQNPVSADKLLIVTFTNAAAAEMRGRIEKRLDEECRKNPSDIGLIKQKHLISSAKICTIDSFCIDLVRENFEKLNVSPDFKISDANSLTPFTEKVINEIIGEYLEKNDPVFLELLNIISSEFDERSFIEAVYSISDYTHQMPFPQIWLESLKNAYNGGVFTTDNPLYKYCFKRAENSVLQLRQMLIRGFDFAVGIPKVGEAVVGDLTLLSEKINELLESIRDNNWDRVFENLNNFYIPKFKAPNGFAKDNSVITVKLILSLIENEIDSLKQLFFCSFSDNNESFKRLYKPAELFIDIVKEYDSRLFQLMCEENVFTFYNTEQLALTLLCEHSDGEIKVKESATEIFNCFCEVLVDEYQDVNDLQDMLFYVLSDKEKNLFVVGDVKQSIYGFRGANPKNFLNKKNKYLPLEEAQDHQPKKIILGSNFRSRDGVCEYINYFFKLFMTEKTGDIIYNSEEELIPAAKFPESSEISTEIHLVNTQKDEKSIVQEATHIAEYIKKIMSSGECVRQDEKSMRNAKYSDFAILLRSMKEKAPIIAAELRKNGIPVDLVADGYIETTEIVTVLSLLKVIDNPKSDIELLTTMMSPIYRFTAEEMAKMRINYKSEDLFSAVIFAAKNGDTHAAAFLENIELYRKKSSVLPLSRFISELIGDTDYLNIVSAMTDGARRKSNLLMLLEHASAFEANYIGGIDGLLRYINILAAKGLSSASVSGGEDTVRLMTIHASKGLQFPFCIIANTSKEFNRTELNSNILYSEKYGVGFKFFDEETHEKTKNLPWSVIADITKANSFEEELRLAYVAFTRAEERLIIVSSHENIENTLNTLNGYIIACGGVIDPIIFRKLNSLSKYAIISAILHPVGDKLRKICNSSVVPNETKSALKVDIIDSVEISDNKLADETDIEKPEGDLIIAEEIEKSIKYSYPYELLLNIEAKSSVSALTKNAEDDFYDFTSKPAFAEDEKITNADRGTAMHKVMQFFNFDFYDNITEELERLYEWKYISENEYNSIDKNALKAFFQSDIFKRILKSVQVKREMRFLTEVNAGEINGSLPKNLADEKIIVQGAVDLCFQEDDEIIIVDFKTDRVDDPNKLVKAYSSQLEIYAVACEKLFSKKIKEKIIYSFALKREINI